MAVVTVSKSPWRAKGSDTPRNFQDLCAGVVLATGNELHPPTSSPVQGCCIFGPSPAFFRASNNLATSLAGNGCTDPS